MTRVSFAILLCGLAVACGDRRSGGDGDSDADADADADADGDADAIPDPGVADNRSGVGCDEVEPNDEPGQATPCGIVHLEAGQPSTGLYVYAAEIGDGDERDFYVFETNDDVDQLHQLAWWDFSHPGDPVDLLDFVLWEVLDDGTLEEVIRYETDVPDFENPGFERFDVRPGTRYLLEVVHVEGAGAYAL